MKKFLIKSLTIALLLSSIPSKKMQTECISPVSLTDITQPDENVSFPKGPKAKSITSASAIVMDADTGLILYDKKSNVKHYPASITKIMTTLLCIENCTMNETVTFKESEVLNLESGASNIDTKVGETLTIEQCLYAIMLASANEVCLGVADYISGDIPTFAELMNNRAKEIGCKNTHFSNPNGLHSDDHYTTAYDMAMISKEALKNSTFRKVAGTKVAYIPKTNKHDARPPIVNHHNMLNAYTYNQYLYDSCTGGKTGYTSMAQSTLVTFAERDGMRLICVVMKGQAPKQSLTANIYTDTTSLLDFAFENYQIQDLTSNIEDTNSVDSPLFTRFTSFFDMDTAPLQTSNNGQIILPNGADVSNTVHQVEFYNNIKEENGKNVIGSVSYTYGNQLVGHTDIYFTPNTDTKQLASIDDIEFTSSTKITGSSKFSSNLLKYTIIIICILIVCLFLFFYLRLLKRRRMLSNRRSHYIGEPRNKNIHF
ncbi:MAG: D-alanyl-D-alanine carboxypeptidase [Lachnospiraceae bacterium]|nr:D-alanyl-D-alanine carboxypeptidase [Lachnospiraceae bacterium]